VCVRNVLTHVKLFGLFKSVRYDGGCMRLGWFASQIKQLRTTRPSLSVVDLQKRVGGEPHVLEAVTSFPKAAFTKSGVHNVS
jgi:hypothetical protein